jgi:hypothetical protein
MGKTNNTRSRPGSILSVRCGNCGDTTNDKKHIKDISENPVTEVVQLLRHFSTDLLGALVPGICFMTVLLVSFWFLLLTICGNSIFCVLSPKWPGPAGLIFLVFAYTIGLVFSNRSVNAPDKKSIKYNIDQYVSNTPEIMAVAESGDDRYPYSKFRYYLENIGFNHLAEYIPWEFGNEKKMQWCNKRYTNKLKHRINAYSPSQMQTVEKHESHVRMMSSLWYATGISRWFIVFAAAVFISGILRNRLCRNFLAAYIDLDYGMLLLLITLLISVVSIYVRRAIEHSFFIHRVHELLSLLVIAHLVDGETDGKVFSFFKKDYGWDPKETPK